MHISRGEPFPLGANRIRGGVNFALFSEHATAVTLGLFDRADREVTRIDLEHRSGDVWHVFLTDVPAGCRYAYRVDGPWNPAEGHRFNPGRWLLDPYARSLSSVPRIEPDRFELGTEAGQIPQSRFESPPNTLGIIADPPTGSRVLIDERKALTDQLIYELHVKGFTRLHPEVNAEAQGRYAGLGNSNVLDYLKSLGVTTLELLPVQEFVDEQFLTDRGLVNYWGYNTIGFFTPTARYSAEDPTAEFVDMANRIHDAGLELALDVVYNHTAEGDHNGPTFSFRGIDNRAYYRLTDDDPSRYVNDSGCGNSLNVSHPAVLQMVMDSLRYWVSLGVDGFRFDLATSLGRQPGGFSDAAPFFQAIRQDPVLNRVRVIAEPWDLGIDGYQLGRFPVRWSEWNDRYRDVVRRFWRGDQGVLPAMAHQLHGASDLFEATGRPPQSSVNFVTCHDGFSLADLVSYEHKHNEANLEANRDGNNDGYSFNCGAEGPTDDPQIRSRRLQQQRNMLTTLLVSQGMPMLLAGDEFGQTQQGNNNAYCQDGPLSWIDWSLLQESGGAGLHAYVQRLISIRHTWSELRSHKFIHGGVAPDGGIDEIQWYHPSGAAMHSGDWEQPSLRTVGLMLHGDVIFPDRDRSTRLVLALFNGAKHSVPFVLPVVPSPGDWHCQLSSAEDWEQITGDTPPGQATQLAALSVSLFEYRSA